jgi:hypothetical protein
MIHWPTVKNALHGWAVAQSGLDAGKVIWAEQDAPSPALPYLTLKFSSLVQVKEEYTGEPDDDGQALISGDREFTLSVQCFGGVPLQILENLKNSLHKFEVKLALPEGLAFIDSLGIMDISEVLDTRFEKRGAMGLLFRVSSQFGAGGTQEKPFTTDEVGVIETVKIEGKGSYEHPGGEEAGG